MDDMKPGQVIRPQGTDQPQPVGPGAPPVPTRPPEEPDENPQPAPSPVPGPDPMSELPWHPVAEPKGAVQAQAEPMTPSVAEQAPTSAQTDEEPGWQFNRPADQSVGHDSAPADIAWTGSEFIAHEKDLSWYGAIVLGGIVVAAADYMLTHDMVSTVVILFAAGAFAAISSRKPRTQHYALTRQLIQIGTKVYYFEDFKNFSITEDGAIASIVLMPLKRFMPPLTIYVSPDMEDQVVGFLSEIMPFEQHRADAVDSLMRRIRF